MCALVLALRKIPIYAPGGGDATLGSSDKPTYSVAVTDTEAAANREAFVKTKEGKRLVPTKKPDEPAPTIQPDQPVPIKTPAKGATGTDLPDPNDSATPSPLRYRLSTLNEIKALSTLNERHPAADTAHDPSDIIDADTQTSGSSTPHDAHRSTDLEEVRGLLRRQSTRGKRKTSTSTTMTMTSGVLRPGVPPIPESALPTPRMEVEYTSYPPQTLDPYLQQRGSGFEVQLQSPETGPGSANQRVPQIPSPVPGNGNAFAQQAREELSRVQKERERLEQEQQQRQQHQQRYGL